MVAPVVTPELMAVRFLPGERRVVGAPFMVATAAPFTIEAGPMDERRLVDIGSIPVCWW